MTTAERVASSQTAPAWSRGLSRVFTLLAFVWKYVIGVVLCQSLLGSLFIVGWTYRLMQRTTLKSWWKASPRRSLYPSFADWARGRPENGTDEDPHRDDRLLDSAPAGLGSNGQQMDPVIAGHASWPNWIIHQNWLAEFRQGRRLNVPWTRRLALPFHSLWLNFKLGVLGAFNMAVMTMPAAVLWLFSWYAGWNNSFHKGYEQAAVGPLLGLTGVFLFIAAMFYVPLAQARQAATGDWKAFYHFPLVWHLVRRHWLACVLLATLYSLCAIPVYAWKTGLIFAAIGNPAIETYTDAQALDYLNLYFLKAALGFFPLYVLTKFVAARVYARVVLQGLQRGLIPVQQLGRVERHLLQSLDLVQINPPRARHVLTRVAVGTTSGVFRVLGLGALGFVWFTFVAQIYISEFLKYNPILGWLNQPLVQLPWFRYIPARLQNQAGELALVAVLLAAVGFIIWVTRRLRPTQGGRVS